MTTQEEIDLINMVGTLAETVGNLNAQTIQLAHMQKKTQTQLKAIQKKLKEVESVAVV